MTPSPTLTPNPDIPRAAGPLLIALAFIALFLHTWLKWPDPLVDFGIQLYTPWQLSQGKVLYRDVASLYGPLSSYFNAALFKLFGASLLTLVFANAALFALLLTLLYRIAAALANRLAATAGCLLVLCLCGFNQYTTVANYNFICPYSHEATHGLLLTTAAFYAFMRFTHTRRPLFLGLAGLCTGLAALTKPEPSLVSLLLCLAGFTLTILANPAQRPRAPKLAALLAASIAAPPLVALLLFSLALPLPDALHAALNAWTSALDPALRNMPAYQEWMGTRNFSSHLRELLTSALIDAAVLVAIYFLSRLTARLPAARKHPRLAVALLAAIVALPLFPASDFLFTFGFARPLPLALLLLALAAALPAWKRRADPHASLRWLFLLFAALYPLRIFFNTRIFHFGFVLTVPLLIAVAVLLLHCLPNRLRRTDPAAVLPFVSATLALLFMLILAHTRVSNRWYALKTIPVAAGPDTFYADPHGLYIRSLVGQLQHNLQPSQSLSVFPQSTMINYLARRPAPNRFIQFEPSEFAAFGEPAILDAFQKHPPDAIVFVHLSSDEFGAHYFGQDYAATLYAWIVRNYTPVGPPEGAPPFNHQALFGTQILIRRPPAAPTPPTP
jgi:hypothetical protein